MAITQLSVFLDNTAGRLCEVSRTLGNCGINIRGFSVADTADFGILRLIVNEPSKACDILREARFTVHRGPVVLAGVPDLPGGFATALEGFARRGMNVDYVYVTAGSLIVFGVADVRAGEAILLEEGMTVLTEDELGQL
jgi:hypothetical protein